MTAFLAFGVHVVVGPAPEEGSTLRASLRVGGQPHSGSLLIVIGLMNLSARAGIVHLMRHARAGTFDEAALEHHLPKRGFLARVFSGATRRFSKPVHLYPVGLLMGMGFDTATQVALLVLSASTASTVLPWYAALVLPLLFASGMLLCDTAGGVVMTRAYAWACVRPLLRRVYYNPTVTVLSVLVAFVIRGVVHLLVWGTSTLVWRTNALGRDGR